MPGLRFDADSHCIWRECKGKAKLNIFAFGIVCGYVVVLLIYSFSMSYVSVLIERYGI